jgi:hypothetical protein
MRVLVACEYSGTVRDAFLALGHDAMSCDILPTESPGPHYQGDVRDLLHDGWDLMVGHPPCTYLSYAGAAYWNDEGRAELRERAMAFFMELYNSPIPRIALENPRGYPCKVFRRPDQEVNPFDFGTPERKRICLWLKNLPPLFCTNPVDVQPKKVYIRKSGSRAGEKYYTYYHQSKNAKERARFFPSVAAAMADQWGAYVIKERAA